MVAAIAGFFVCGSAAGFCVFAAVAAFWAVTAGDGLLAAAGFWVLGLDAVRFFCDVAGGDGFAVCCLRETFVPLAFESSVFDLDA